MRDIKGYEGLYAITSCGKVWSYRAQKFMSPRVHAGGYLSVHLSINGKEKCFLIHRLVAEAYIPNPDNLPQIDHIDGDKTHNWINNLQWITNKDNAKKKGKYGRRRQVHCIETGRIYRSCREAAKAVGLACPKGVSGCCKGYRQTAAGYHWEYVD